MRVLVTGSHGFVGRHVAPELERGGHEILAVAHPTLDKSAQSDLRCDIQDAKAVERLVRDAKPDACLHLAGIAFVPSASSAPQSAFSVNVLGTINLLEAFRANNSNARILVVSTSQVYGNRPAEHPLTEDAPMAPDNLYAVSKMAADLTALLYARQQGMNVLTARPCNHIGPGQSRDFAVAAFAEQVAAIAAGRAPAVIRVGNMDSERHFLDVRDVARAYRLLLERGHACEAYNIAAAQAVRIRDILDMLCRHAGIKPEFVVDPARFRPTDSQPDLDAAKIAKHVGWKPEIALADSIRDILDHARAALKQTA